MQDKSIPEIFQEICSNMEVKFNSPSGDITLNGITFLFGDTPYINNILTIYSKSPKTSSLKFPFIALFTPFTETRNDKDLFTSAKVSMMIAINTKSEYTNEQRLQTSFINVLRPIYNTFISDIRKNSKLSIPYNEVIAHNYRERYDLGSRGAMDSNDKKLTDLIDAIELENLIINVKKHKCLWQQVL